MIGRVDAVVIGAGVVGLAVGRALALGGAEVLVLERLRRPGEETSSRNSGVIHSGIYYPRASLKAQLCVRGRHLLYEYCEQRGIACKRLGKLVVAQADQNEALLSLEKRAHANGVTDVMCLTGAQVRALEPEVRCAAGLLVPATGIVDVPGYVSALHADVESQQGSVVLLAEVLSALQVTDGFELEIRNDGQIVRLRTAQLVNAAGLHAVAVAAKLAGYPPERLPTARFAKGNYFSCRGPSPFSHLVYPMPNEAGLGVHATLDLSGRVRFGPDVEWVEMPDDYRVAAQRASEFYDAIRTYWPGLPDGALQPDYAGVRPKIVGPGEPAADFVVEGPAEHGIAGLINLFGIESPGLTSSLAIGELVAAKLNEGHY